MAFPTVTGVHLLPSTGEFAYDTDAYIGFQRGQTGLDQAFIMNYFAGFPGGKTDYSVSIDALVAQHSECKTVSVVIAWFFNSEDASTCNIYPTTNFIGGAFLRYVSGPILTPESAVWLPDHWQVSGLTELSAGLIPPATNADGTFVYGGTPSDQSVVRCIQDLKSRGFKVVFYPFLLGTSSGFPWRGRITSSGDLSAQATSDVATFMGPATTSNFVRDTVNLTVGYTGNLLDWTYRRMILHYANLCIVAGGVNLFVIGSELRGLEILRGPAWTKSGTTDGSGNAVWDYPMVAQLSTLANDVRSTFDAAGFTRDLSTLENLIVYSADWSSWMGWQHTGENGQWPHLDQLWANPNIDFVSFDNYMPLTDWTTGSGGLDAANWKEPKFNGVWPPQPAQLNGLGLSGPPTIYSTPYLKGNIEGGQYFDWFYNDSNNRGRGLDPAGTDLQVSLPEGDRLAQARNPYFPQQEILANKQLRWWWNNLHQAVYDNGDGQGFAPHGPNTEWAPNAKSIITLEYGFAACDRSTNQPNVFYDPKSTESFTAFWSIWDPGNELGYLPRRDDTIQALALEAVYEYWNVDGNNETVGGLPMLNWNFCCVWNTDARPFPTFPILNSAWGDAGNWAQGLWIGANRAVLPPPAPSPPPTAPDFPTLALGPTITWSVHIKPKFKTEIGQHVSGRETRRQQFANPYFDVDLTYDLLRGDAAHLELQAIVGFFEQAGGGAASFWVAPPGLSAATAQAIGVGDGSQTVFSLVASIGSYTGPVYGTTGVATVFLNGVAQPSGWSVSSGYLPAITFASAPDAGVAISSDFGILWLCRFAEDVQDFEEFMTMLWALRTVRLMTVRP
jgi:uncharacterized protein (TIGR02217 family)